jgi:hypothetical protein
MMSHIADKDRIHQYLETDAAFVQLRNWLLHDKTSREAHGDGKQRWQHEVSMQKQAEGKYCKSIRVLIYPCVMMAATRSAPSRHTVHAAIIKTAAAAPPQSKQPADRQTFEVECGSPENHFRVDEDCEKLQPDKAAESTIWWLKHCMLPNKPGLIHAWPQHFS